MSKSSTGVIVALGVSLGLLLVGGSVKRSKKTKGSAALHRRST